MRGGGISDDQVGALARLAGPLRRRLYEFVVTRGGPVSREDAATETGIGRSLAAYHLDKLAADGLLETSYARTSGRTGPGAGRTAKLYQRSEKEIVLSLPPRRYTLAASLLAAAIADADAGPVKAALIDHAHRSGLETARQISHEAEPAARGRPSLHSALTACGYEPYADPDGTTRMRNCPFHRLAAEHRTLVCSANLAFVQGLLEGIDAGSCRAVLDPQTGQCCVAVTQTGY